MDGYLFPQVRLEVFLIKLNSFNKEHCPALDPSVQQMPQPSPTPMN